MHQPSLSTFFTRNGAFVQIRYNVKIWLGIHTASPKEIISWRRDVRGWSIGFKQSNSSTSWPGAVRCKSLKIVMKRWVYSKAFVFLSSNTILAYVWWSEFGCSEFFQIFWRKSPLTGGSRFTYWWISIIPSSAVNKDEECWFSMLSRKH